MLRYKADRRTLAFMALYFGLVIASWNLITPTTARWWIVAPVVALIAVVSWINAVITHNTLHSPMFRSRFLNRVAQVVLSLTYGYPVSEYVPGHNLSHHKYTQSRRDVMRTTKVDLGWNLASILAFFPRVAFDVLGANMRYMKTMKAHHKRWYHQFLLESSVTWGLKIVLALIDWRKCLLFVVIPHLYAVWGITTVNYLQHDGCDADSEYNHSRNFVGRIFNWFTFNNGFHAMHHAEPGLHWSRLAEEHEKRIKPFIDPRLDEPSLLFYLLRTFVLPGKRMRYDGRPVGKISDGPDEEWIPMPKDTPQDVSLGAEALS